MKSTNKYTKTLLKKRYEQLEELFKDFNKTKCTNCQHAGYKTKDNDNKNINRGCCVNCNIATGYFNNCSYLTQKEYTKQLNKIQKKYNFNNKYGFFNTKTMQCSLPRTLRSQTCQTWACEHKMTWHAKRIFTDIMIFKELNKLIN